MKINRLVLLATVLVLMVSCNTGDRGQLTGDRGKEWHPEKPYGMTAYSRVAHLLWVNQTMT